MSRHGFDQARKACDSETRTRPRTDCPLPIPRDSQRTHLSPSGGGVAQPRVRNSGTGPGFRVRASPATRGLSLSNSSRELRLPAGRPPLDFATEFTARLADSNQNPRPHGCNLATPAIPLTGLEFLAFTSFSQPLQTIFQKVKALGTRQTLEPPSLRRRVGGRGFADRRRTRKARGERPAKPHPLQEAERAP